MTVKPEEEVEFIPVFAKRTPGADPMTMREAESLTAAINNPTGHLQKLFDQLVEQWHGEWPTYSSSISDCCMCESYQMIIGLGPAVVPLIIERLKQDGGHWFWALRAITRVNPVAEEDRGNMSKMTTAWIDWYENNWNQD